MRQLNESELPEPKRPQREFDYGPVKAYFILTGLVVLPILCGLAKGDLGSLTVGFFIGAGLFGSMWLAVAALILFRVIEYESDE